jgi:hypothetical protein
MPLPPTDRYAGQRQLPSQAENLLPGRLRAALSDGVLTMP